MSFVRQPSIATATNDDIWVVALFTIVRNYVLFDQTVPKLLQYFVRTIYFSS